MQKKNKHGGAQVESKLIEKYADQWCRDNGYPIIKRKRTRYSRSSVRFGSTTFRNT